MLNPSKADAEVDDPTIRRCINFSKKWGFDALRVVNLFALRATDPRQLRVDLDPESESNLTSVLRAIDRAEWAVAAWGTQPRTLFERSRTYRHLVAGGTATRFHCLGSTRSGEPRHPLYVSAATEPAEWTPGV